MARPSPSTSRRAPKDAARRGAKKKVCVFCKDHVDWVDYKDVNLLRRFMRERGKIRARRVTGNCAQHQRDVQVAIKTARELALLPYTQRTVTERRGGRGNRDDRGPRPPRSDAERPAAAESPTVETPDVETEEVLEYVEDASTAAAVLVEEVAE